MQSGNLVQASLDIGEGGFQRCPPMRVRGALIQNSLPLQFQGLALTLAIGVRCSGRTVV